MQKRTARKKKSDRRVGISENDQVKMKMKQKRKEKENKLNETRVFNEALLIVMKNEMTLKQAAYKFKVSYSKLHDAVCRQKHTNKKKQRPQPIPKNKIPDFKEIKQHVKCDPLEDRKWDFDPINLQEFFNISINAKIIGVYRKLKDGKIGIKSAANIMGVSDYLLLQYLTNKFDGNEWTMPLTTVDSVRKKRNYMYTDQWNGILDGVKHIINDQNLEDGKQSDTNEVDKNSQCNNGMEQINNNGAILKDNLTNDSGVRGNNGNDNFLHQRMTSNPTTLLQVQSSVKDGLTFHQTMLKYPVSFTDIYDLVRGISIPDIMEKPIKKRLYVQRLPKYFYSARARKQIVRFIQEHKLPLRQAAIKTNVNFSTLRHWQLEEDFGGRAGRRQRAGRKFKPGAVGFLRKKYDNNSKEKDWILKTLKEGTISIEKASGMYGVTSNMLQQCIIPKKHYSQRKKTSKPNDNKRKEGKREKGGKCDKGKEEEQEKDYEDKDDEEHEEKDEENEEEEEEEEEEEGKEEMEEEEDDEKEKDVEWEDEEEEEAEVENDEEKEWKEEDELEDMQENGKEKVEVLAVKSSGKEKTEVGSENNIMNHDENKKNSIKFKRSPRTGWIIKTKYKQTKKENVMGMMKVGDDIEEGNDNGEESDKSNKDILGYKISDFETKNGSEGDNLNELSFEYSGVGSRDELNNIGEHDNEERDNSDMNNEGQKKCTRRSKRIISSKYRMKVKEKQAKENQAKEKQEKEKQDKEKKEKEEQAEEKEAKEKSDLKIRKMSLLLNNMRKAIDAVIVDNIPHLLVAKKFGISKSKLIPYLTGEYQIGQTGRKLSKVVRKEAMENIKKKQCENATQWIPKAIKGGYASINKLRWFKKYGASREIIEQYLMNDGDEQPDSQTIKSDSVATLSKTEDALFLIKVGGMSVKDASTKFNVPLVTLQDIVDGKLEIGKRHKSDYVLPRKTFKPGGKEYLQSKQPDGSKDWILDKLEEGTISVNQAALLFGIPKCNFNKSVYTVNEVEMRRKWSNANMLKAVNEVKTGVGINVAACKFKVPRKMLTYFVQGKKKPKKLSCKTDIYSKGTVSEESSLDDMKKAIEAVKDYNIPLTLAARQFGVPLHKLITFVIGQRQIGKKSYVSISRKARKEAMQNLKKKCCDNAAQWVHKALKEGYDSVRSLRIWGRRYGVTSEIIRQYLLRGNSENVDHIPMEQSAVDTKLTSGKISGFKIIPRKFKDGGKEHLRSKIKDKSKEWILESIEQGTLTVPEAGRLCGFRPYYFMKWLYPIKEDESGIQWSKDDMENAVKAVKTDNMSIQDSARTFNVPTNMLKSFIWPERNSKRIVTTKHEEQLKDWLLTLHDQGQKVSTPDIFNALKAILAEAGKCYPPWEKLTYPDLQFRGWIRDFVKRRKYLIPIMETLRKRVRRSNKELQSLKEDSENIELEENNSIQVNVASRRAVRTCNSRKRKPGNDAADITKKKPGKRPKVQQRIKETTPIESECSHSSYSKNDSGEDVSGEGSDNDLWSSGQKTVTNTDEDDSLIERHSDLILDIKTLRKRVKKTKKQLQSLKENSKNIEQNKNNIMHVNVAPRRAVRTYNSRKRNSGKDTADITMKMQGKRPKVKQRIKETKHIESESSNSSYSENDSGENVSGEGSDNDLKSSGQKIVDNSDSEEDDDKVIKRHKNLIPNIRTSRKRLRRTEKELQSLKEDSNSSDEEDANDISSNEEGFCANCGGFYDAEGSSSDVWICCGATDDDGSLIDGCGGWFHLKCTDLSECDISAEELLLLTWRCQACSAINCDSSL